MIPALHRLLPRRWREGRCVACRRAAAVVYRVHLLHGGDIALRACWEHAPSAFIIATQVRRGYAVRSEITTEVVTERTTP